MKRREFVKYGGAAIAGVSLGASGTFAGPPLEGKMKAGDVQTYLRSLNGGWVNLEKTVDTFKAGDPETVLKGIAVGWMSYTWALRKALDLGLNMFVTHEPTYYDHWDNNPDMFEIDGVPAKKKFIEESGIVILRCHDLWDQYPKIGIPDSWGQQLGFSNPVGGEGWFRVYDVSGRSAGEVARQVAGKVKVFGQEAVQLIGDEKQQVKRVAIGCGAITPYRRFLTELGVDLAICTDDGFTYWRDGALAIDLGLSVILVNHPIAEEYGMELLADRLAQQFPGTKVKHIPQRCMYRIIQA
ncbi:Nif3-like dinuclear metal center hexameric protein [candidate division KSB1 bacterium]